MSKIADDFLRAYSPGQVSFIQTIASEMEVFGLSSRDLLDICNDYLAALAQKNKKIPGNSPIGPPVKNVKPASFSACPECGRGLRISPVNVSKCTNIGGKWKTSLECKNPTCRFTELSEKSTAEWGHNK